MTLDASIIEVTGRASFGAYQRHRSASRETILKSPVRATQECRGRPAQGEAHIHPRDETRSCMPVVDDDAEVRHAHREILSENAVSEDISAIRELCRLAPTYRGRA